MLNSIQSFLYHNLAVSIQDTEIKNQKYKFVIQKGSILVYFYIVKQISAGE